MARLRSKGISVTIVNPGFMKTKMTEGKKTIMALDPSYMADCIYEGVARRDQFISDPYTIHAIISIVKSVPASVFATVMSLLKSKKKTVKVE